MNSKPWVTKTGAKIVPHSRFISDYLTSSKNVVKYGCQFTLGVWIKLFHVLIVFPGNERI